jgi:tripartite motif-containing protein 2/3
VVINFDGQLVGRISTENLSLFPNGVDVSDQGDILVGDSHGNQFHVAVFDCHGQVGFQISESKVIG